MSTNTTFNNNNVALITGASGGIGAELARIHAAQKGDLVLVARSEDKLQSLKQELTDKHGINVKLIVEDMESEGSAQRIYQQIQQENIQIDTLINNAGWGGHGKFHQRPLERDLAMIQLNVSALVELTHLVVQDMVARNQGRILNLASTAGFLPGPLQATYYATKAFVLSFSEAIAEELKPHKITVTALCPGPVATGFAQVADLDDLPGFKLANSAEKVAAIGYRAMLKGKRTVIDSWLLSFGLRILVPLTPRNWVTFFSRLSMTK